jgi:hypothetical protein
MKLHIIVKQALHTMTHYYEPGAPYFYLCVQNKCYLFASCEQGCLLLHPKNPADNTFETSDKRTPEHRCYFTIFINIYVHRYFSTRKTHTLQIIFHLF